MRVVLLLGDREDMSMTKIYCMFRLENTAGQLLVMSVRESIGNRAWTLQDHPGP